MIVALQAIHAANHARSGAEGLLLILAFGAAIGFGLVISYRREFDAGLKHGERESIKPIGDSLEIVHWLAQKRI